MEGYTKNEINNVNYVQIRSGVINFCQFFIKTKSIINVVGGTKLFYDAFCFGKKFY